MIRQISSLLLRLPSIVTITRYTYSIKLFWKSEALPDEEYQGPEKQIWPFSKLFSVNFQALQSRCWMNN